MEKMQFKTNIKCSGCIEKVTPYLNETVGETNWHVDTMSPDKILTIENVSASEDKVVTALQQAGYKAEKV